MRGRTAEDACSKGTENKSIVRFFYYCECKEVAKNKPLTSSASQGFHNNDSFSITALQCAGGVASVRRVAPAYTCQPEEMKY